MKQQRLFIVALLLVVPMAIADGPPATTAADNALIGRWRMLSYGPKKLSDEVSLFWTFDDRNVIVTVANGDVATRSRHSLRAEGTRQTISLTEAGRDEADRVGLYELKEGTLRIQVTLFTGKPPERWDEKEVMLFERAAVK
jgi:hypothetical protein